MKLVLLSGYSSFCGLGKSLDIFNVHDYERDEYNELIKTETPESLIKEAFNELRLMASNDQINYDPTNFRTDMVYDELTTDKSESPLSRKTQTHDVILRNLMTLNQMGLIDLQYKME